MTTPHVYYSMHNTQYMKLLVRQGYSAIYDAQNNSLTYEFRVANEKLSLLCLYLHLWSVGSGERSKMQGTSVLWDVAKSTAEGVKISCGSAQCMV